MKHIIIGTTAINRPELHSDVFPEWIEWLDQLDRTKYTIMWYIHIDTIASLKSKFSDTKENFERKIQDKFKVLYIKGPHNNGNFLKACKTLSSCMYKCANILSDTENVRIIWLEDDWKLNTRTAININELLETCSTNLSMINLTFIRNNYIHALAPSISGFNLWVELFYKSWSEQKDHIDPEHCVGLYYLKHYGPYQNITNCTIINKRIGDKILNYDFMNYENSKYTIWNPKYMIKQTDRYVDKKDIMEQFEDEFILYRITSGFCIDGCEYGRKFMENLNIIKSRVQTKDNTEFYKVYDDDESLYKPESVIENDLSLYKTENVVLSKDITEEIEEDVSLYKPAEEDS